MWRWKILGWEGGKPKNKNKRPRQFSVGPKWTAELSERGRCAWVWVILPLLSGNAMVKPHGSFWRKSHLNFPTAMANQKFFCSASPLLPSWLMELRRTQCREAAAASSNYGAKLPSQRRSKEDRDERETHTQETETESERREHAILVQRESRLTMDE